MTIYDKVDLCHLPGGEVYHVCVRLSARCTRVQLNDGESIRFVVRRDLAIAVSELSVVLFSGRASTVMGIVDSLQGCENGLIYAMSSAAIANLVKLEAVEIPEEWYWEFIENK